LRALKLASPEIASFGASIVAISDQRPENAYSLTERHSLSFPILSDID
jgi:peroxiredoxin